MSTILDLTTLHPVTLRHLLTSAASPHQGGPLTPAQQEQTLRLLGHIVEADDTRPAHERYGWLPTVDELPIPAADLQAWLEGLAKEVRLWIWDGAQYVQGQFGAEKEGK